MHYAQYSAKLGELKEYVMIIIRVSYFCLFEKNVEIKIFSQLLFLFLFMCAFRGYKHYYSTKYSVYKAIRVNFTIHKIRHS